MAKKENRSPEWFGPLVVGVGTLSAIISLGLFAVQIVPSGAIAAIVVIVALVVAAVAAYTLKQGSFRGSKVGQRGRYTAWLVLSVSIITATFVGGRLVFGLIGDSGNPKANIAYAADRNKPYPIDLVSREMGGQINMNKTPASTADSLAIQYYVVSDPEFWQAILERKGTFTKDEMLEFLAQHEEWVNSENYQPGDQPEERNSSDFTLMASLLDSAQAPVVSNDTIRFASYLWGKYLRDRKPVGRLERNVSTLKSRLGFDARLKSETVNEYRDIVWYDADNKTLLADGWLSLDPLSAEILKANPDLAKPIVKAGGVKWTDYNECGDDEPGDTFEYAFVVPRAVQLIVLDIENTSADPIDEVSLSYASSVPQKSALFKLRPSLSGTAGVDSVYRVPGGLDPGEHMILPVGIRFGPFEASADYDPSIGEALGYFGPSAVGKEVTAGGRTIPIRQFDERGLSFISLGWEGGSCPELWTWGVGAGRWVKERNVIVGADAPEKKRLERQYLQRFDGRLLLREAERETSYIDAVAIEALDASGRPVRIAPERDEVQRSDGLDLRLDRGQQVVLDFPGWRTEYTEPRIVIEGYYTPYNNTLPRPTY